MISEDIKKMVFELAETDLSKRKIAERLKISESSVFRILRENKTKSNQADDSDDNLPIENLSSAKKYVITMSDQLFYNLNRIADKTGRELSDFLNQIEYVMDEYLKITDKPIYLFDFLLDISKILIELGYESDEKEKIVEVLVNLAEKERFLSEIDKEIAENEAMLKETRKNLVKEQNELVKIQNYKNQFAEGVRGGMQIKKLEERIEFMQVALTGFIKTYPDINRLWFDYTNNLSKKFNKLKK